MERLTEWKDDRNMLAKPKFSGDFGSANVLGRLAEYEDLEDRLNGISVKQVVDGFVKTIENQTNEEYEHGRILTNVEADKWREYKKLEEQGRLVILPCKDVYFIVDAKTPKYALVMKRSVRDLAICEIEKIDKKDCKYFSTEEKAEARLKELKGEA